VRLHRPQQGKKYWRVRCHGASNTWGSQWGKTAEAYHRLLAEHPELETSSRKAVADKITEVLDAEAEAAAEAAEAEAEREQVW
jgi:hypothetical protein